MADETVCMTCGRRAADPDATICSDPFHLDAPSRPARDGETCDERFDGVADARLQCRDYPNGSTGHTANPSASERDGETLSDGHFTDEHIRAIETACEKLWNGIPAENPIHGPRPHDHPLYVIASAAHLALNAACAEIAALRTKLADARVDAERLDWMESTRRGVEAVTGDDPFGEPTRLLWVCDEADAAAMLPTLREAIDAARAASGKDASHV